MGRTIEVHVKTNSPSQKVEKGDIWKVSLTSKPVGGAANKELVKLLEKEFKHVEIIRGKASKKKLLLVVPEHN